MQGYRKKDSRLGIELPLYHLPCLSNNINNNNINTGKITLSESSSLNNGTQHSVPDLLGFSATQAMVMPPISESLNRRRNVPLGLDISMSCACCLFTKPRMALHTENRQIHLQYSHKSTCMHLMCFHCHHRLRHLYL